MAKPIITITVSGGMIQDVDWPEELKGLFCVVAKDYDDPEEDAEGYREDDNGFGYVETGWADPA